MDEMIRRSSPRMRGGSRDASHDVPRDVPRGGWRGGVIFSFDALLASMLLFATLLVVLHHYPSSPPVSQTSHYSQDMLLALNAIPVSALNDSWVLARIADGSIDDPSVSVLEQIGAFWATNETGNAYNLSRILIDQVLPADIGFSLKMGGEELVRQDGSADPRQVAVARRMITGIEKGEALEGSTSTAYLKQIQGKTTHAFAYFGGFVGQGDITARLDNLPSDIVAANVYELFLEGEFDGDFDLFINGDACGATFASAKTDLLVQRFNITGCANLLLPGNNTVLLAFTGSLANASVSGGLLGVRYTTAEFQEPPTYGEKRFYLPDIDGVINLYDGFMVPGSLINMTLRLHYWVDNNVTLPIYFDIGNTTIFTFNATGENNYTFTNAYLDGLLDYNALSDTTTPFRFGFYEGNTSNSSGNITDVFLLTSRHNSMSTVDIVVDETTTVSRIEKVKDVDDLFVDILLNASGNRVGLVSFGTGASVDLDNGLTTDSVELHSDIAGYAPHSTDAQRYLCGAMETAKAQLLSAGGARKRAVVLMTDGDLLKSSGNTARCAGSPTSDKALIWADAVKQACDASDPVHGNPQNITFYTVAFGPEAVSDPDIIANLTRMANCTGGMFASGTNSSELEDIYRLFAEDLAQSSIAFTYQRATSADNVESRLYGDSAFEIVYQPNIPEYLQNQIPITFQTEQFASCTPSISIPAGLSVIDAHITSYSGDFWTKRLEVDGSAVYNLSVYGQNYTDIGDPFLVLVPPDLLTAGDHSFSIALGANASQDASCSMNNSLIYTALIETSTSRTSVLPLAIGCNWNIEFEDGHFLNVTIPSSYAGANNCSYTNASRSWNDKDAYDYGVSRLLDQLDFDDDGRLFINIDEADLEIIVTLVSSVPYLWGPTFATLEVWR